MTDRDDLTIIKPSNEYRSIHGSNLAIRRVRLLDENGKAVTQAKFAAVCGHDQSFQCRLEAPGEHEVTVEKAGQVESAIAYFQKFTKKTR